MLGGGYGFADAGPANAVAAANIVIVDASVSAAFIIRLTVILLGQPCGSRTLDEAGPLR
jgi:hypothetical protein